MRELHLRPLKSGAAEEAFDGFNDALDLVSGCLNRLDDGILDAVPDLSDGCLNCFKDGCDGRFNVVKGRCDLFLNVVYDGADSVLDGVPDGLAVVSKRGEGCNDQIYESDYAADNDLKENLYGRGQKFDETCDAAYDDLKEDGDERFKEFYDLGHGRKDA